MKQSVLYSFLNNIASFSSVDIRLFLEDDQTFSALFYDKDDRVFEYFKDVLLHSSNKKPRIVDSRFGISFAVLPFKNSVAIIGPVLTIPYELSDASKLARTSAFDGIDTVIGDEFLSEMPYIPILKFTTLVDSINAVLSSAVKTVRSADTTTTPEKERKTPPTTSIVADSISRDFENKLISAISNGLTEKLKDILSPTAFKGSIGVLSTSSLRQTQNMLEVLVTICSRAALLGGLPPSLAYSISDKYTIKIEKMNEPSDFMLGYELVLDFAKAVKSLRFPDADNYTVVRAQRYIDNNILSSLSLSTISTSLNLNKNYLSSLFRKHVGMTMTDYILLRKINYAKYLLDTSDLKLTEIAYRLSFSSQSAFSNRFKQITGMTPKDYRASSRL